jgi:hypothetical protein
MAMGYEPKGLLSLPSHRSKDVHEEMRFTTTLPKLYQRPTPVPIIPLLPVMPPPPPAPYFSSPLNQAHLTPSSASTSTSSGLMVLDGSPVVEVSSLSNAYVKRELSAELYSQVKSHVVSSCCFFFNDRHFGAFCCLQNIFFIFCFL